MPFTSGISQFQCSHSAIEIKRKPV